VSAKYTNLVMYNFDEHQVRLTFFDKGQRYSAPHATPSLIDSEEVAELVMTRQTFRAFLQILNGMATIMPPIGIPDEADRPLPQE
jgi:hypothetical protein